MKGQVYSGKSSGFVLSGSLPISLLSCSVVSVAFVLLVLNYMSSCFIIHCSGHLVNHIVPFFQLTSRLCLTSQSWPKNISVPSNSVTTASNCSLWLLISISREATFVTSPFFIPSVLKTSNEKFIGFVGIFLFLTNYSSIPVYVHPKSTNVLILSFFSFFVSTFACTFNSLFPLLLQWFGIIYLL